MLSENHSHAMLNGTCDVMLVALQDNSREKGIEMNLCDIWLYTSQFALFKISRFYESATSNNGTYSERQI